MHRTTVSLALVATVPLATLLVGCLAAEEAPLDGDGGPTNQADTAAVDADDPTADAAARLPLTGELVAAGSATTIATGGILPTLVGSRSDLTLAWRESTTAPARTLRIAEDGSPLTFTTLPTLPGGALPVHVRGIARSRDRTAVVVDSAAPGTIGPAFFGRLATGGALEATWEPLPDADGATIGVAAVDGGWLVSSVRDASRGSTLDVVAIDAESGERTPRTIAEGVFSQSIASHGSDAVVGWHDAENSWGQIVAATGAPIGERFETTTNGGSAALAPFGERFLAYRDQLVYGALFPTYEHFFATIEPAARAVVAEATEPTPTVAWDLDVAADAEGSRSAVCWVTGSVEGSLVLGSSVHAYLLEPDALQRVGERVTVATNAAGVQPFGVACEWTGEGLVVAWTTWATGAPAPVTSARLYRLER